MLWIAIITLVITVLALLLAAAALAVAVLNFLWDIYAHYTKASPPSAG